MLLSKFKNKYFISLIVLVLLSVSLNIFQAVNAATYAPGSTKDPIVAKSYVDTNDKKATDSITALQTELDKAKADVNTLKTQVAQLKSRIFKVVTVDVGKKLTAKNSTEIILRSGNATAIKGTGGGLSDVTSGKDLASDAKIIKNHLLISSRNDGRGLNCITKCTFLIRGSYEV